MKRIEKDHWYITDNKLSISLMSQYVDIEVMKNDKFVFYKLRVIGGDREELVFNFYSLEDAVHFTEDVVSKCYTNEEVSKRYRELCEKGEFTDLPTNKNKIVTKDNKMTLDEDDIIDALIAYFGKDREDEIDAKVKLAIVNNQLDITFYLVEEFYGTKFDTRLTIENLVQALNYYLADTNYDLVNFEYLGGIKRGGFKDDEPFFDGIEMLVQPKEIAQKLALKREEKKKE